MIQEESSAWDGVAGTAGGPRFGAALRAAAAARDFDVAAFARASDCKEADISAVFDGARRATPSELARFARTLRLRAFEFMQRMELLSLDVYARGLDPLYFLPEGTIRKDARIYMREINPRHAVPERDMLVRNPTLKALLADDVLDDLGKLEIELTYLLRAAIQQTGGVL